MTRTNIDIDDRLVENVMRRFGVRTKREAVELALRMAYLEPMTVDEALAMEGVGWSGDLDDMRAASAPADLR